MRRSSLRPTSYDLTDWIDVATLNGVERTLETPIVEEGAYELIVTVTDALGWSSTVGPISFRIDKTPPALTLDSHQEGAVVATSPIVLSGFADDATEVFVNGVAAPIDPVTKRWTWIPSTFPRGVRCSP